MRSLTLTLDRVRLSPVVSCRSTRTTPGERISFIELENFLNYTLGNPKDFQINHRLNIYISLKYTAALGISSSGKLPSRAESDLGARRDVQSQVEEKSR